MRAFGKKIILKPDVEEISPGGIVIPQMGLSTTAYTNGVVVSVGELVNTDVAEEDHLAEGMHVMFEKGVGIPLPGENDEEYIIMRGDQVLAKL